MEFNEIQEKVMKNADHYSKEHNVTIDKDFASLKLYEEVGEFSQALLVHYKKCREIKYLPKDESKTKLSEELADVLGMVIVNAKLHDIDLEDALYRKWISNVE